MAKRTIPTPLTLIEGARRVRCGNIPHLGPHTSRLLPVPRVSSRYHQHIGERRNGFKACLFVVHANKKVEVLANLSPFTLSFDPRARARARLRSAEGIFFIRSGQQHNNGHQFLKREKDSICSKGFLLYQLRWVR